MKPKKSRVAMLSLVVTRVDGEKKRVIKFPALVCTAWVDDDGVARVSEATAPPSDVKFYEPATTPTES